MTLRSKVRLLALIAFTGLLFVAGLIAIAPERAALPLVTTANFLVNGTPGTLVIGEFPEQMRHLRRSVQESEQRAVLRSWTPDRGMQSFEVVSEAFKAAPHMSVVVTGATRTEAGANRIYLSCSNHSRTLDVSLGSTNVNGAEALVRLPANWCSGDTRLHLVARDTNANVGVGAVFAVSAISALKSSFLGLLPYLTASILALGLIGLLGSAVAEKLRVGKSLGSAFALSAIGLCSLAAFYMIYALPKSWSSYAVSLSLVAIGTVVVPAVGRRSFLRAAVRQRISLMLWSVGAFGYFSLLWSAQNGLGHWEPNYRFWPASWSSDNELPWILAEAVRSDWPLSALFGGGWSPTDRPPLMAGAHLLVSDFISLLQANNDGNYLRGHAHNAAAIAMSALWIPAAYHLLHSVLRLSSHKSTIVLLTTSVLPFTIFNTVYGWPKAFGAAFGILAAAMAVAAIRSHLQVARPIIVVCAVLAALSLLAHGSGAIFIAPMSLALFFMLGRDKWPSLALGGIIALTILATWTLFKTVVLPSSDPLTKFALTGDFGMHDPAKGLGGLLFDRYSQLSLDTWLDVKWKMLLQPLWPVDHSIHQIHLNRDFGADLPGRLRAWDSMLLSAGNALILAAVGIAAFGALRIRGKTSGRAAELDATALASAGLLLAVWLVMAVAFLIPLVVHVWPQAAILTATVVALAWMIERRPLLFKVLAVTLCLYSGLVWFAAPLREALYVDGLAVVVLILTALVVRLEVIAPLTAVRARQLSKSLVDEQPTHSIEMLRSHVNSSSAALSKLWSHLVSSAGVPMSERQLAIVRGALVGAICLSGLAASAFFLLTASSPLIDDHSFRQTQTAIAVFEMTQGGPLAAYFVPVLGAPWALPFEAPVYHLFVVFASMLLPLEVAGRFVSFAFHVGSIAFGSALLRQVAPASRLAPFVFALLTLASPLYLFWGRSFLIETCALFFGMAFLYYGHAFIVRPDAWRLFLFAAAGVIAALAKTTTWPGFVAALALLAAIARIEERKIPLGRLCATAAVVGIAFVVALLWTAFADAQKLHNALGGSLTSQAVHGFVYGTAEQRLSEQLWNWTVFRRVLPDLMGSFWPLAIPVIVLSFFVPARAVAVSGPARVMAFVVAFMVPLLLFTNVHIVHNYYQVANGVFLIMAVSIALGTLLTSRLAGVIATAAIMVLVLGQVQHFRLNQFQAATGPYEQQPYVDAGAFVRSQTQAATTLLALGVDWSPIVHFYAQRKGLALPAWMPTDKSLQAIADLSASSELPLASVVDCRAKTKTVYDGAVHDRIEGLIEGFARRPEISVKAFDGCRVFAMPVAG